MKDNFFKIRIFPSILNTIVLDNWDRLDQNEIIQRFEKRYRTQISFK